MKIKLLINASTLRVGGGIQVATSFFKYFDSLNDPRFDLLGLVSTEINDELCLNNINVIEIKNASPAKLFKGRNSRKLIKEVEEDYMPDIVYSIGYPSYIKFNSIEIGRYTNPWEFYSELPWFLLSIKNKLKVYFRSKYRLMWARNADYIETQTTSARDAIAMKLKIDISKIFVIPNTINQAFLRLTEHELNNSFNEKIIFCLAADHPHKNLKSIPRIAYEYKKLNTKFKCKFLLTLPPDSASLNSINEIAYRLGVNDMILNLGTIDLKKCSEIYRQCSVVLQPSLLEVFSATYIEAMYFQRPLLVPDVVFARDICKKGARYYKRNHDLSAAQEIKNILENESLHRSLILEGKREVRQYIDIELKYKKLLDSILDIYKKTKES